MVSTTKKIMVVYAYLWISTDYQDVANQRSRILDYVNSCELDQPQFVEDVISGRLHWQRRTVGRLLTELTQVGDVVVFAEVSHMAPSALQVLEILEHCMVRGLIIHIVKQQIVLDGSVHNRSMATMLEVATAIEREFISQRTQQALAKRRAASKPLASEGTG